MSERIKITLTGDVGTELGEYVKKYIQSRHPNLDIWCSIEIEEAQAIPLEDMLVTAAAVAAVLSFILNVGKVWLDRKNNKKAEAQATDQVAENLREYNATGFEVESVKIVESTTTELTVQRVVVRDVPNQVLIEVERRSESRYTITRRRVKKII